MYGMCELIYGHDGPHSRVPGGSTEPNTWAWGDCACDPCKAARADQIQRELDARNGEIRCLRARIAALESQYLDERAKHTETWARLQATAASNHSLFADCAELRRVYGDES
jgi:hypothetical protein